MLDTFSLTFETENFLLCLLTWPEKDKRTSKGEPNACSSAKTEMNGDQSEMNNGQSEMVGGLKAKSRWLKVEPR